MAPVLVPRAPPSQGTPCPAPRTQCPPKAAPRGAPSPPGVPLLGSPETPSPSPGVRSWRAQGRAQPGGPGQGAGAQFRGENGINQNNSPVESRGQPKQVAFLHREVPPGHGPSQGETSALLGGHRAAGGALGNLGGSPGNLGGVSMPQSSRTTRQRPPPLQQRPGKCHRARGREERPPWSPSLRAGICSGAGDRIFWGKSPSSAPGGDGGDPRAGLGRVRAGGRRTGSHGRALWTGRHRGDKVQEEPGASGRALAPRHSPGAPSGPGRPGTSDPEG